MGLQLGRAAGIALQTLPYTAFRAVICLAVGICGVAIVCVVGVVGGAFGVGAFWVGLAFVVLLGVITGLWNLLAFHLDILPKAGHIALITEIANQDLPPTGLAQIGWCRQQQHLRFADPAAFRLLRSLVKRTMRDIHGQVLEPRGAAPFPGMEGTEHSLGWIVGVALSYLDGVILAHVFRNADTDVFTAAKKALTLYCDTWKGLFRNAFRVALLAYAIGIVVACAVMVPLGVIAVLLPAGWDTARFVLFLIALFLGFSAKWVIFDPIAHAALATQFFEETAKLEPDPAWADAIEEHSEAFHTLCAHTSATTGE